MDFFRLLWICQRRQLRAGCHGAAARPQAVAVAGRRQKLLSLTRTIVPWKGALAPSCQEPSSHWNLAGLPSPLNLCPPPQPSPPPTPPRTFPDWINKIHPRVARNTSGEGILPYLSLLAWKPSANQQQFSCVPPFADIIKPKNIHNF